jgi:hypothetical protein
MRVFVSVHVLYNTVCNVSSFPALSSLSHIQASIPDSDLHVRVKLVGSISKCMYMVQHYTLLSKTIVYITQKWYLCK